MHISKKDRTILRELGLQYAQAASTPEMREKIKLYRAINDLKPIRPVVIIEELPWHELNINDELTLRCEEDLAKHYEDHLRKQLFKHKHMRADMVMPEYFTVHKHFRTGSSGINVKERTIAAKDGNHIVAHEFFDTLATEGEIDAIHLPDIEPDIERTQKVIDFAHEVFGDILPVRLMGHYFTWAPWDIISYARGVTPLLLDLYDKPELMHKLMKKLLDIANHTIDKMEEFNLFGAPNPLVHCTAGYSSDLPSEDEIPEQVNASHVWGRGTAQIFAHVSPEMHDEFDIIYQKKVMERFGLCYYGCCEPLHNKIDILRKIQNLRKISITPWADIDLAAERIGSSYVLAAKPNPAYVAVEIFDPDVVRKEIIHILDACKRNNTTCEFVIKDISTTKNKANNLFEWEKTAMETVLNYT